MVEAFLKMEANRLIPLSRLDWRLDWRCLLRISLDFETPAINSGHNLELGG